MHDWSSAVRSRPSRVVPSPELQGGSFQAASACAQSSAAKGYHRRLPVEWESSPSATVTPRVRFVRAQRVSSSLT